MSNCMIFFCFSLERRGPDMSEWGLTSRPTQYRSFWRWPLQAKLHIHIIIEQKV